MVEQSEQESVRIPSGSVQLEGLLGIPKNSKSIVIFAHGSGSGRFSSRNNFVARVLRQANLSTLLFDLLTEVEDRNYENRFDIPLLGKRLVDATKWILDKRDTKSFKIGYFGASTGAAAALIASTLLPSESISAIVSRGGRPDMAMKHLKKVSAPTLLIVGGNDEEVIELNRIAFDQLDCEKRLEIVPGATHLFEEPGTLEQVSRLASEWFVKFLK
ncbi:MAG: dienelactone hydrolase family protein [Nitrososphaerota archaeon]|nr:dienelactone hydrolase family protein [Nitrososphaerota archaeon]